MVKELDLVVLTEAISAEALKAGDVGTVVFVYNEGEAFEVEFPTKDGGIAKVVTLEANQVRPAKQTSLKNKRIGVALKRNQGRIDKCK